MVSQPATATLKLARDHQVQGEILVGSKRFALAPAKLQNGRWQGNIQMTLPARGIARPNAGEIQLSRFKKGWTLVLKIPATGETVVLLKN